MDTVRGEKADVMSRKERKAEARRLRRMAQEQQTRKERRLRFWKRFVLVSLIPLSVVGVVLLVRQLGQPPTSTAAQGAAYEPLVPSKAVGLNPINDVDPVSGKPVRAGSPTTIYKGYVIGFCCQESPPRWERMSESDKDAFVRRFISPR
jgi:hypothetical protein